jgi:H(+)-translocating pyrophosphatase
MSNKILQVSKVTVKKEEIRVNDNEEEQKADTGKVFPWTQQACYDQLIEVSGYINAGAKAFLMKEYSMLSLFCILFAGVLICAVDQPWRKDLSYPQFPYTTVCFLVGAATSMLAGYIGMMIATKCNVKVTYLCCNDKTEGFKIAFAGGQVLGFVLVGIALLVLEILIISFKPSIMGHLGEQATQKQLQRQSQILFEMISGYGLGGSTVALFGRVGGGIYTKAADVGADLAGKVISNLPEDSPLNPGTIADNVGDNVGDIAGMGADLFGSLAESTCAALVVSGTSWPLISTPGAVYFPLMVTAVGIAASFITVQFANMKAEVDTKLRTQLIVSTILMTIFCVPLLWVLPDKLNINFAGEFFDATRIQIYGCLIMGLWSGLLIGLSTEYYTSHSYGPTRELARACLYSGASNVIKGLALGYMSNVIPIICLSVTVLFTY